MLQVVGVIIAFEKWEDLVGIIPHHVGQPESKQVVVFGIDVVPRWRGAEKFAPAEEPGACWPSGITGGIGRRHNVSLIGRFEREGGARARLPLFILLTDRELRRQTACTSASGLVWLSHEAGRPQL